jgi:hypothetical protein
MPEAKANDSDNSYTERFGTMITLMYKYPINAYIRYAVPGEK